MKNDKEIKYLQKTIIQMELKQLAESIAMVIQKKRLKKYDREEHSNIKNRPLLWQERLDQQNQQVKTKRKSLQQNMSLKAQYENHEWRVSPLYLYNISFDASLGVEDTWIDHETLNFFNAQRDNIYVSSSKYDVVQLKSMKTQYYISSQRDISNTEKPSRKRVDSNSRKRSKSPLEPMLRDISKMNKVKDLASS